MKSTHSGVANENVCLCFVWQVLFQSAWLEQHSFPLLFAGEGRASFIVSEQEEDTLVDEMAGGLDDVPSPAARKVGRDLLHANSVGPFGRGLVGSLDDSHDALLSHLQ